ncbi:MAG: type I DNA topoisomerase [Chitinophagales bacterium]|nr:type I DNA topoisomerase [Chitinophagales bacterium]
MAKNLLIVESPAKAKTIEKFLGKDFKVTSSNGHIRDLPKGNNAIDIAKHYQPKYVVPKEKEKTVSQLKKLAKEAEEIWLATDEDREGEAISWHLCEVLGLQPESTKRIVFHEITKPAIQKAVSNPRFIDLNLVNAQQARRVLDRLVGFELSPILWKKVSMASNLSAGRVQSVAVRIIVEREREIQEFKSNSTFKITAQFNVTDDKGKVSKLKAEYLKKIDNEEEARQFLESCKAAKFTIKDIQTRPAKKSPAAPFTTSTLQQEASRKLSFSVTRTMSVAQKLYEAGHITYMRTDSVNLSDTAIDAAAKAIGASFGEKYVQSRRYKTKASGAQEAHEAIRPTYFENRSIEATREEQRLYDLIWKRAVASQMSDAQLERTTVKIDISTNKEELTASGEVLLFDGFLKLYIESDDDETDDEDTSILPPLKAGQNLILDEMVARERFSKAQPRYNEASLVKKLEELGIGRPSTYAPTISTIQKRGYVEKLDKEGVERPYQVLTLKADTIKQYTETEVTGAEKAKLFPTDIGKVVNDFLTEHFSNVLDYHFTAKIEEEFDHIAGGTLAWNKMIDSFYKPFHQNVEQTAETAERATGERELGIDPESGKPVIVRIGRYGPMAQIGKTSEDEKPRFAKLKPSQNIDTITLNEALELFKFPISLGSYKEKDVTVGVGRFGPYVKFENSFVSIPKEKDPKRLTLEEAIGLIEQKQQSEQEKFIQSFEDGAIQILKGLYGPYIKAGKKNVKIPKDKDPYTLTLEECKELVEKAPEGKKPFRRGKK